MKNKHGWPTLLTKYCIYLLSAFQNTQRSCAVIKIKNSQGSIIKKKKKTAIAAKGGSAKY